MARYAQAFRDRAVARLLPPERSDNAQRVARIHAFMNEWLLNALPSARVLDIGVGTGVFLSRFLEQSRGRGWSAHAVEPDPVAAGQLRGLARFQVMEALFSPDLGRVDLMFLWQLINVDAWLTWVEMNS